MADEPKAEKPLGGVRMKAKDKTVSGVSVNGRSYTPDKNGFFFVRPEDITGCEAMGHEGAWE